jgi:hypothetical protein
MDADAAMSMQLRVEGEGIYDFLLHDDYSGGSLPEHFFSEYFFRKVHLLSSNRITISWMGDILAIS